MIRDISLQLMGNSCHLKRITPSHFKQLAAIVLKKENLDLYQFTTLGQSEEAFKKWFDKALTEDAFIIFDKKTGQTIGSSRFYQIDYHTKHAKIGYTWLSPCCIGTGINNEVKYLMLTHAFEQLNFVRVGFDIDTDNIRSRKAVEKLGAKLEGELRQHRTRTDGTLSNTCCYSIINSEWQSTKDLLSQRISTQNFEVTNE